MLCGDVGVLSPFLCSGNIGRTVIQCPNHTQFVDKWVVGVKQQILVGVCGFSVDRWLQGAVGVDGEQTVQKSQLVVLNMLYGEFDMRVTVVDTLEKPV